MKRILILFSLLALILSSQGCSQAEMDIVNDPFLREQEEVAETLQQLYRTAQARDLEKLASYHLYAPKFTDFKSGKPRADAEANKQGERAFFSRISGFKYDLRDLKVSVFGDVAIATFHGYFYISMGEEEFSVQEQCTLVFVKSGDSWKIVHEHFSPLDTSEHSPSNQ